jgi:predicted Zn-dependent peptidase
MLLLFIGIGVFAQKKEWKQATVNGYTYRYVTGDPLKARFYTLKNGLTVILSPNSKEPRLSALISVRTGSNNDPKDHTGLAHYLEHVLFKGTEKYGSLNWTKEKPYLDEITGLYEAYNKIPFSDTLARKAKYHEIDSVSGVASKYAIANEYDKMMAAIGSQGSNAHTWVEETVYNENIPSNAIDKFLTIQGERFRDPIFRLFHTELEAVYEEKNRSLDNDDWKMQEALYASVFPTSNYGQQTTIGTVEHLKNPSLVAIRNYYNKYYVPNNMAIILSGDFNPDELIKKVDKAFAYMQPKPVQDYVSGTEPVINGPVIKKVYGPTAEKLEIGYRVGRSGTKDAMLADLASSILYNGNAGLFDLNLNKQQKLQKSSAGTDQYKDYGVITLSGTPKERQSLDDVKNLLLEQIDILKKGDFDASLIKAIVANYKLEKLKAMDNNDFRANYLSDEYIKSKGADWNRDVAILDEMSKVTKQEIVDFAKKTFTDNNYVVVFKRKGEDKTIVKVDKPAISPVETNADRQSGFVKNIASIPLPPIQPKWIDYNTAIQKSKSGIADVLLVPNKENSLFSLYYYFEMGSWNNKILPIAFQYLSFLGTDKYTSEQISKAFYNMAVSFQASAGNEESTLSLTGLGENFDKAAALFEDLLTNCKVDEAVWEQLKSRLKKSRADNKTNKNYIGAALRSYATYGAKNPFNYVLSNEELDNLKAEDLVQLLHTIHNYEHSILYYGSQPLNVFTANIAKLHKLPAQWSRPATAATFHYLNQNSNQVLFADYDMVQSEIFWIRKLEDYAVSKEAVNNLFNAYFGSGMGALVFQTIRESKGLAYSTFAAIATPRKKEYPFSFIGYVGSQADKLPEAVSAMNDLLGTLPAIPQNLENARTSLKKDIETERITKENILFNYLALKRKGINYDYRKDLYQAYDRLTMDDVKKYHDAELAGKPYTYSIVASEKKVSDDELKEYGDLKKISLEDLFGY